MAEHGATLNSAAIGACVQSGRAQELLVINDMETLAAKPQVCVAACCSMLQRVYGHY